VKADTNVDEVKTLLDRQELISRKLRLSKERFDQLAEQSHSFIWEVDLQGKYTYASHTVTAVLGYTPGEMVGKFYYDFAPESETEALKEQASVIMLSEKPFTNFENLMVTKSGLQVWVVTNGLPMSDEHGHTIGYRGMDMEITERKRLEAELRLLRERAEAAYQAKTDFLANMSYEIRTPMTALLGYISLLEITRLNDEQKSYLNSACESARLLMMILENILDYNQMEARNIRLKSVDFPLRDLMESCMMPLANLAGKKKLEMMCTVDADVPDLIRGDPFRLRQVLNHLLHNAVKFTDEGEVLITCALRTGEGKTEQLRFEVSDTGPGFAPGVLEESGVVSKETGCKDGSIRPNGLGIGLSISNRLVSLMGGEMGVVHKKNKGSRCWFTLPLERAAGPHPDHHPALLPLRDPHHKPRVLIVEDHAICRDHLTRYFTNFGMEVHAVETAFAALQLLETSYHLDILFDAALIDLDLPGMDGKSLGVSLHSDDRFNQISIFFMCSINHKASSHPQDPNGFAGYIYKPVRESELRKALNTLLKTIHAGKPHEASKSI